MIREATITDWEIIYNFICEMENTNLNSEFFYEVFKKQCSNNSYKCLVYEEENMILGFINLRFEDQLHHTSKIAEIMELVVSPDSRGKGIGHLLMEAAVDNSIKMNCTQLEVSCNQLRVDTHRFYEREGMNNFHYKFSKSLSFIEANPENKIGR